VRDFAAIRTMTEKLSRGTMIIYPEGTRSRDGRLSRGRRGVGKLVHDARPTVVPVAIEGTRDILPVGARFPRLFKRIKITIGRPMDLQPFYRQRNTAENSRLIVDTIMGEIGRLKGLLHDQSMDLAETAR
jgi:1-acyl-sn-glycerol-3-phosphate acyltransferase